MADTSQPTPRWRMVYCTHPTMLLGTGYATTGTKLGEIVGARERVFAFNLNKAGTLTFKLDLAAPQATLLLQQKTGLILLYRNNTLAMTAEVSGLETNGADGEHDIAVTATETMWPRLTNRIAWLSEPNGKLSGPTAATDQGTWLVTTVLGNINNNSIASPGGWGGDSGIGAGSVTASGNITGGVWYFKSFMELVQELSATAAGFDFWQTPLDPTSNGGRTGNLNIAPLKGSSKPNVVFEFGTGRANALSYKYIIDNTQLANSVFVPPSEWPNSAGLGAGIGANGTSAQLLGTREVTVNSDIQADTLRQQIAAQAATVRGVSREQFFIQPAMDDGTGRVPQFMVDYTTGDIIRGRVQDQSVLLLDANVRVYGVSVALDDQGQEIPTLTVVNEP